MRMGNIGRLLKQKQDALTQETLKKFMRYNPRTGVFTRIKSEWHTVQKHVGKEAGWLTWKGYRIIMVLGHKHRAHRLAFLYMTGKWPKEDVDHINRDPADNRWRNLREASRRFNLQNGGLRKSNTSGFRGVGFDESRQKWRAQIRFPGQSNNFLGRFDTKEEASAAYQKVARRHFGKFALRD